MHDIYWVDQNILPDPRQRPFLKKFGIERTGDLNTSYGIDPQYLDKMKATPQNSNGLLRPTQSTLLSLPLEILGFIARWLVETVAAEEKYASSFRLALCMLPFLIVRFVTSLHSFPNVIVY